LNDVAAIDGSDAKFAFQVAQAEGMSAAGGPIILHTQHNLVMIGRPGKADHLA
jgi:hypothetical protein